MTRAPLIPSSLRTGATLLTWFLALSLVPLLVISPVVAAVYSESFDVDTNWNCFGSCPAYGDKAYADVAYPQVTFSAALAFRQTEATQDGFPATHSGAYAWRLQNAAGSSWQAKITTGGVGTFSVWVRRWDSSPDPNYTVEYSTDNGSAWTTVQIINNAWLGSSDWKQVTGTINVSNGPGDTDDILIRITRTAGERLMVDDFEMSDMAGDAPPAVASTTPSNGATNVAANADLVVTFSEPVDTAAGWYLIECTLSGNHLATQSGGPTTFILNPVADFTPGESCTATIYAGQVTDQDTDDPPDEMEANHTWSFGLASGSACATELFISEYVEGSSYNKAVEIVNATGSSVDLAAYSVYLSFNGGTSQSTIPLSGTLNDGDVWLLCHSSASFATSCDQTSGSLSFNGDDAVALRRNGANIDVIGQIGTDPGTEWGTGDTGTADNTLRRKSSITAGDTDGSNAFDPAFEWDGYPSDTFDGLGSHTVDCSEQAPSVAATTPANGAAQVATNADITVTFREPVNVAGSWYTIDCDGSGSHTATVSGGPTAFTLNPDSDFLQCEQCTVTIVAAQVTDQDTDDPPDAMEADYSFDLTTACACATISQIQGLGASSPCDGMTPSTLSGCVTGVTATGFYLQDVAGDGSSISSDGIYVYMYSTWANLQGLQAGYEATVAGGEVQEYYGATEVYNPDSVTKGAVCTLPSPIAVQQIQALGDANPTLYETVEFMRVQMPIDGHVQGPTRRYVSRFPTGDPEIGFVPWGLVGSLPRSPRIFEDDYAGYGSLNYLSGACSKDLPDVDFGDRIQSAGLIGVMAYNFDKWQLVADETLSQALTVTDNPDVSDVEPALAADEFAICTFNVENLFDRVDDGDGDVGDWVPASDAEYQAMLQKRARAIVEDLRECTLIGIQEIEGKEAVWSALLAEIVALGGTGFAWDYYESMDSRDITVGVLYDASRATLVGSTQRQGCTSTDYGVDYGDAQAPRVVANPCTAGTYPLHTRPPYVGTFQVTNGPQVVLIVNHFKSMSEGAEVTRPRREAQAEHNAALVYEYSATIPNVAVVGDLNDHLGSTSIGILNNATTSDGQTLVNVHLAHVTQADRYTYNFSAESGVLDYVYLSKAFDAYHRASSPVHINADFPEVAPLGSDNCPGGTCVFGGAPLDASSHASSDHDPVFVRLGNAPTALILASFAASPRAGAVLVEWETATEMDTLGFNLYRSDAPGADPICLNDLLIPAQAPGSPLGALYTWLDAGLWSGQTYYYWLEDVDVHGVATRYGPLSAMAGYYRFYLPLVRR